MQGRWAVKLKDLIREYRKSLRLLRRAKVKPLYYANMVFDTRWAVDYMETGRIPGTKWTVARWRRKDREILFDPQILDRCFRIPDAAPEVSEGVRLILEHLLSCLSAREREAFVLIYGQGFSYNQTAEFMGCNKGSVQNYIRRAENKFSGFRDFVVRKQAKGEGDFFGQISNQQVVIYGNW